MPIRHRGRYWSPKCKYVLLYDLGSTGCPVNWYSLSISIPDFQNWLIFSHVEKNCQKKILFLCRATSTAWATHKNSENQNFMYPGTWNFVFSSNSCTRVHDVLFFLQIHVPGYMEFWFFFKSMYPGTWNFDFHYSYV